MGSAWERSRRSRRSTRRSTWRTPEWRHRCGGTAAPWAASMPEHRVEAPVLRGRKQMGQAVAQHAKASQLQCVFNIVLGWRSPPNMEAKCKNKSATNAFMKRTCQSKQVFDLLCICTVSGSPATMYNYYRGTISRCHHVNNRFCSKLNQIPTRHQPWTRNLYKVVNQDVS